MAGQQKIETTTLLRRTLNPLYRAGMAMLVSCAVAVSLFTAPGMARERVGRMAAKEMPDEQVDLAALEEIDAPPSPLAADPEHTEPIAAESYDEGSYEYDEYGLPMPADGPPAPILTSGEWFNDGLWYFQGDVIPMSLDIQKDTKLTEDRTTNAVRQLRFAKGDLGIGTSARMTLGRNLFRDYQNRDHSAEFTFLGLGDWSVDSTFRSAGGNQLFNPNHPLIGGFNGALRQRFEYVSHFNSYEANYRIRTRLRSDRMVLEPNGHWIRRANPGLTYSILAGVRYWTTDEMFNFNSQSSVPALRRGNLDISTSNHLLGVQMGGDAIWQFENWNIGVRGKVGPYVNWTHRDSHLVAVDPVFLEADQRISADAERISMIGEFGVFGTYFLQPWLSIRLGYELVALNSMALAIEQIDFDLGNPARVRHGGDQLYQGFSLGFEANW